MHESESVARTHDFWLLTCGIDTYIKGSSNARNYTPWNGFTSDGSTLVCSLWEDQILKQIDPVTKLERRFVKLGGLSKKWFSNSIKHGKAADKTLQEAYTKKRRIVGYEVQPNMNDLAKGVRSVDYFYLDRAYELKPRIGLSLADLVERLSLDMEFLDRRYDGKSNIRRDGTVLELVALQSDAPHAGMGLAGLAQSDAEDSDEADLLDDEPPSETVRYANLALPILVSHVLKQKDDVLRPLTYLELATAIGRHNKNGVPWARGMGRVLGKITEWLDSLESNGFDQLPFLTTVVVAGTGVSRGLPGAGIKGKWSGYDQLTRPEKEAKILAEYERILDFGSRWYEVLSELDKTPMDVPEAGHGKTGYGRGGGESPQHKALKLYVASHPEIVGVRQSAKVFVEYDLHSGDCIDVFFRTESEWTGVEVKSSVSDGNELDYRRGVYQAIKYQSVLMAQAKAEHSGKQIAVRSLLVTESSLPPVFVKLCEQLGVEFRDQVRLT